MFRKVIFFGVLILAISFVAIAAQINAKKYLSTVVQSSTFTLKTEARSDDTAIEKKADRVYLSTTVQSNVFSIDTETTTIKNSEIDDQEKSGNTSISSTTFTVDGR